MQADHGTTQALADELVSLVEKTGAELRTIGEVAAAAKRGAEAWSIKEVVGHLIDSAANNHQRFVRALQADELSFPAYDQNAWVRLQDHQSRPWPDLVEFWALYNRLLAHTIARIPETALEVPCRIGPGGAVTLRFLIEDYLVHLRHHLEAIKRM